MSASRFVATAALLLALITPVQAEERARCLTRDQQRAAIAEKRAVPLATAIRTIRRTPREVVNARLCEQSGRLVYLLTGSPLTADVLQAHWWYALGDSDLA